MHIRRKSEDKPSMTLEKAHLGAILTVSARPQFDDILLEAIDETFSSLGEPVKTAIYFHLENTFRIKRSEIPHRVADFSIVLEKIFGTAARNLEILVMKNLHEKVEITCEWPEYRWPLSKWIVPLEVTFQEYVRLVRQNFESTKENNTEMEILLDTQEKLQH